MGFSIASIILVLWPVLADISAFGLASVSLRPRVRFPALTILSCCFCLLVSCGGGPSQEPPSPNARLVEHAMGSTYVPETVERVVTVDTAALDASLALGIKPVGSVVFGDFPSYLGDRGSGIQSVGDGNQPNLEKILQLQPDLILSNRISSGRLYNRLSRIAPTVLSEGSGRSGEWQSHLRLFGEALGRTETAAELLQDYEQRVAQLRGKLGDTSDTVVSVVTTGRGRVGFYTVESFPGSVLQDLGFARPPLQADSRQWAEMVSQENLASLDGDIIFLIRNQVFSDSLGQEELVSDPIWSQLGAVKQGRLYQVEGEAWIQGRNILAAHQILDDVAQALEGERE
ncbi:MAG: ABC transporter substrate-binding protein [Cyanophyceae cyanobacterium]